METTRNHIVSAFAVAFLFSHHCVVAKDAGKDDLDQQISKVALAEINSTGTPSIQIAIGLGNKVIYESAFGMADVENNVAATSASRYRTASVAKWFTATAAMKLANSNVLNLDVPIQTYCPQYPKKQWDITARQLITHTSGIRHYRDYEKELAEISSPEDKRNLKIKALEESVSSYTRYSDVVSPLQTFKEDDLLFKPGTDWQYSSYGYRVLACVLQGASGKSYVDTMKSVLFEPANMSHTVPDDAWAIIPDRVSGYQINKGELRRADLRDVSENLPAGGYLSTASDLIRFAMAFDMNMLPEATKQLMTSTVLVELDDDSEPSWRDAMPQEDKYGYGVMLLSKYSNGMLGHSGRQAGGSAILVLFPQEDLSIAVMSNAKGWNGYLNFVMKIKAITDKKVQAAKSLNKTRNKAE